MPRWKKLVQLGQVTVLFISLQFIGLGSDDLQGHAGRRQPFIGFAVDGKAGMAQVDEEAQDAEVSEPVTYSLMKALQRSRFLPPVLAKP